MQGGALEMRMTPEILVRSLADLRRDREYAFVNERNHGRIRILEVCLPLGPVVISRYQPGAGETAATGQRSTISSTMLLRVANAVAAGVPMNIDRVLGASYNTRSVLESLLAHTPQFYVCRPGRIEVRESSSAIMPGHKHLLWLPGRPHEPGRIEEERTELVISELPSVSAVYEALVIPDDNGGPAGMPIEIRRRHAQIQVALVMIAESLGMRPFVAKNDQAIMYDGTRLGSREKVVSDLSAIEMLAPFSDAVRAGSMIDCIWFRNGRFMPAVIEIEHTTGVTPGLTRMLGFKDRAPNVHSKYVIAAPDEDRERVMTEIGRPQFISLSSAFMPYSAVEELHGLVQHRRLRGRVNDDFIEAFLERAA
jgi:type II restriction enzyme